MAERAKHERFEWVLNLKLVQVLADQNGKLGFEGSTSSSDDVEWFKTDVVLEKMFWFEFKALRAGN